MLLNATFSDVVFKCENETFPAHRSFLSARSPVFHKMFLSGMSESRDGIVVIEDCGVAVFKELLKFLYTGNIRQGFLKANIQELFAMSDKYALEDLKLVCEKTLLQLLTAQTAVSILLLADKHHSTKLKKEVMNYAVGNFKAVITSSDFAALCNSNPQLVGEFNLAHADFLTPKKKSAEDKKESS